MDPHEISEALQVNVHGHLTIGGCDTVALAENYGTPLYVMDENTIRNSLREFRSSIADNYENGGAVAYASKACSFKELYRIVKDEGCYIDVVSCGELYTALSVGFPAEHIIFHGNNKTTADLQIALTSGVGRIVVDNPTELDRLSAVAVKLKTNANIFMRITPGIDAHTHDFVKTGQIDSKFGFTLENGEALDMVGKALSAPNICLKGMHCHIGSQIFDEAPFEHAAEVMLGFLSDIRKQYGVTLNELNLGGGFGVKYTKNDTPLSKTEYMKRAASSLKQAAKNLDFPVPFIIIEPGRSIVASSGITLYTVGGVKHIPNIRTYVSVDGGMADNPRYALYKAEYTALIANKAAHPADTIVTIAGRCCESGDILQENTALQSCKEGDILAVLATGAYNYSMCSHYNRLPNPAVVMVKDGESRIVVKAETFEDIIKNDI